MVCDQSSSSPTFTVTTAKGGSAAGAAAVVVLDGTVTITNVDNSGTGPAIGGGILKIARGNTLRYQDQNGADYYFQQQIPRGGAMRGA